MLPTGSQYWLFRDMISCSVEMFITGHELGNLVVLDPRDEKSYQIHFDPGPIPASRSLHPGSEVSVTANFDGTQYVANQITIQ